MATVSPAAHSPASAWTGRRRRLLIIVRVFFVLLAIGYSFVSANWPYRYRIIKPMLEDDLASQLEIKSYRRTYFPNPGFVATGLTLRRKSALHLLERPAAFAQARADRRGNGLARGGSTGRQPGQPC